MNRNYEKTVSKVKLFKLEHDRMKFSFAVSIVIVVVSSFESCNGSKHSFGDPNADCKLLSLVSYNITFENTFTF